MKEEVDVGIIGGGPAGLAAGMYLARLGVEVYIFEKDYYGGLLIDARRVENYPGLEPMSGPALAALMKQQAEMWGARFIHRKVDLITHFDERIHLGMEGDTVKCKALILAMGTEPDVYTLDGAKECYTRWNEIPEEIGDVIVLGLGDAAYDQALSLYEDGVQVTLIGNTIRANHILKEEVRKAHIPVIDKVQLEKVEQEQGKFVVHGEDKVWTSSAVLVSLGRIPLTEIFNYDKPLPAWTHMAGDIQNGFNRQASIAAGDGIKAAMIAMTDIEGR